MTYFRFLFLIININNYLITNYNYINICSYNNIGHDGAA